MTRPVEHILDNPDVNQVIADLLTEVKLKPKKKGLSSTAAAAYLRKFMQPGDVVIVGPTVASLRTRTMGAYYRVSTALLGSNKNVHIDLYIGGRRLVTAEAGKGVIIKKVKQLIATRSHIAVFRPRAAKQIKKEAIAFAKKQIGKGFSYVNIGGAIVKELASGAPAPSKEGTFTCSGLIARAYSKLAIGKEKKNRCLSTPRDFRKSRDFAKVFELNRDDKGRFQVTR
jgi:uncharacterized protein YycO